MENASKALLIAGAMLISMLIVGALVLLGNNIFEYQNKQKVSQRQSEIGEFNNQFEPYNKDDLTLMELKSVYNKIKDNNSRNPMYKIESNLLENNNQVYSDINKDFDEISEDDKQRYVFKCEGIKYEGVQGRISEMNFKRIKPLDP